MNERTNLLIEIGMEELPTKAVTELAAAGKTLWAQALDDAGLPYADIEVFSSPRRLAWRIRQVALQQPNRRIERKGPALKAAKTADGQWSKAAVGFAASCGVAPEALSLLDTPKGQWLMYYAQEQGQPLQQLLPALFNGVTDALPVAKRMRWANHDRSFVRPVQSLVVLADDAVMPLHFFGVQAGRESLGHRVHHPAPVTINHAMSYEEDLRAACVMVSHAERMAEIRRQVAAKAAELNAQAVIPEGLAAEVASLTEWPVAITGSFDAQFLDIPQEVLITTMQDNQKTFAVVDKASGKMRPYFIAVANLHSKDPACVRKGNEKVIRPRFADARFFWQQDLKQPLEQHFAGLEKVIYQEKLGSLADKSRRIAQLGSALCALTGASPAAVEQAALLAKCDLLSEMVMEFPELQGFMGRCYAEKEGLDHEIAAALEEQYFPVGAGGVLPETQTGLTLALAEKLDTIVGGFAIGAKPTGSKDPYALRRMAIGLIRLINEKNIAFPLGQWLRRSGEILQNARPDLPVLRHIDEIQRYIIERLDNYYRDQDIAPEIYQAVQAITVASADLSARDDDLRDFDRRVRALHRFRQSEHSAGLLASAKRIRNILRKNGVPECALNPDLLQETAEKNLWQCRAAVAEQFRAALEQSDYDRALNALNALSAPLEDFFNEIMVMTDDTALRNNRLALLHTLQQYFDRIADLSLL